MWSAAPRAAEGVDRRVVVAELGAQVQVVRRYEGEAVTAGRLGVEALCAKRFIMVPRLTGAAPDQEIPDEKTAQDRS